MTFSATLSPVGVANAKPVSGPDTVDTAKATEDLSARTETSTTFLNPDGTKTLREYGSPIRLREDDGSWSDNDYNLVQRTDGSFEPRTSATDIVIGDGGSDPAAAVHLDDGASVSLGWPTGALPEPTVKGGVATYSLSRTTDLIVAVIDGGVSTTVRFNERPSQEERDVALKLKSTGVQVTETQAGGLQTVDSSGEKVGTAGTMLAWDSRTDAAGDPLKRVRVDADLTKTAGAGLNETQELALETPDAFLDAPDTVYPVTVDPDISSVAGVRDTFVQVGQTSSYGSSHGLAVGSPSNNTGAKAVSNLPPADALRAL